MVSPRPDLMGQPPVEAGRRAVVDAEVVPPSGPGMVGAVAAEMVSALTEVAFREATADEWIVAEPALRDAVPGLPEPVHSGPRVLVADSWDTAPQPMVQQDSYSGRRRAVAVNTRLWLVIGLVVAALSAAVAVPWMLTTDVVPAAQTTPEAAVPAASDEPDPTEISATASAEPGPSTSAPMPAVGASPLVTESPSPAVPSFNLTVQAEKGGSSTAWGGTAVTTSFAGATVVDKLGEKWLTSTIDGWLEFRNINAPAAGAYSLKIYYVYTSASPSDTDRRIQVTVNGTNISPVQTFTPSSTVQTRTLSVTLRAGNNTIRLTNDNYQCPAIDKIEISQALSRNRSAGSSCRRARLELRRHVEALRVLVLDGAMGLVAVHDRLIIRGAREHNLRDVNLDLPRDAMIVFTGLSGSGKSSLAFDTIFAEGQRRYVESLSSYARQFLGQMDKPDVDFIEGLSPAVSIDQKSTSRNPRSTVGTITEVYDYLRLLFARAGEPHCPICGVAISRQTPQQIVDRVLAMDDGTRFQVLAPVVRGRKGEYVDLFAELQSKGFARARVDGMVHPLTEPPKLKKQEKHTIEVVVDRLAVKASAKQRMTDSIETALKLASRHRGARVRRPARGRRAPRAQVLRAPGLPQRPPAGDRGPGAAVVLVQRARTAPARSAPAWARRRRSTRS